jgi:hypothetical protein
MMCQDPSSTSKITTTSSFSLLTTLHAILITLEMEGEVSNEFLPFQLHEEAIVLILP